MTACHRLGEHGRELAGIIDEMVDKLSDGFVSRPEPRGRAGCPECCWSVVSLFTSVLSRVISLSTARAHAQLRTVDPAPVWAWCREFFDPARLAKLVAKGFPINGEFMPGRLRATWSTTKARGRPSKKTPPPCTPLFDTLMSLAAFEDMALVDSLLNAGARLTKREVGLRLLRVGRRGLHACVTVSRATGRPLQGGDASGKVQERHQVGIWSGMSPSLPLAADTGSM